MYLPARELNKRLNVKKESLAGSAYLLGISVGIIIADADHVRK